MIFIFQDMLVQNIFMYEPLLLGNHKYIFIFQKIKLKKVCQHTLVAEQESPISRSETQILDLLDRH